MDIEIIEMTERKGKFKLKNTSPAMANALRRTMLSDIPKMAIDEVEFHLGSIESNGKEFESVTPLFDEVIAHRLGMVPVPTDYDLFTYKETCSCKGEGCPSCTIMYSLNKQGPCTVLSGDMMPLGDSSLSVKDENIPIVELTDGQAVLIYAKAVMGTAKKHVKWQAAFGVGYSYLIDEAPAALDKQTKSTSKKAEKPVSKDPNAMDDSHIDFLFTFETDGSLTAKQVLEKAVSILSTEAKEILEQLDAL
ncbi:MAG: DNA-directed RNA polymerase subunit D [Candidatus Methanomethylophilaceae archaeon]|nr:DNA-directed RNA polymerase subunit D [Candidatus Methanomethylophilaceae archaeon]